MGPADVVQDENALLYTASHKLTQATTPYEQLDAVSDLARSCGAVRGVMFYITFERDYRVDEVVAEWVLGDELPYSVGTRFRVAFDQTSQYWFGPPAEAVLIPDTSTDPRIGEGVRDIYRDHNIVSAVILPLYNKGRWVAGVLFGWNRAYDFNQRDQRVYTLLLQLAAPSVDSARLIEQTQKRADELEAAQREMEFLYASSHMLINASTPTELLEAVSFYAREMQAVSGQLFYFDNYQPEQLIAVATWAVAPAYQVRVGFNGRLGETPFPQHWLSRPEAPTLVTDIEAPGIVDEPTRRALSQWHVRGLAILPLYNNARFVGMIAFSWDHPYTFVDRDERIFTALQQQAAPVADSIRLMDQTRRRSIELEQANQEINLLYRTSEEINGANTYAEVVEAVAQFDTDADVVTLMLWDTLDWETAEYLEVLVVIDRKGSGKLQPGARLRKEDYPIAKHMMGDRVWMFEDATIDPRVDPVTAASWAAIDIRSFIGPALYINKRWMGGITFHSDQPRHFSQREERLFTGVGDLVLAAIERIRSREETEAARRHAEDLARTNAELFEQAQRRAAELESLNAEIDQLYHVGELINAADTYDKLVQAVSGIISDATAVALFFWEGWNYETATYVEQVAATGTMATTVGQRTPKEMLPYTQSTKNERLMVLSDVAADPRLDAESTTHLLGREMQAALGIRLFSEGRWLGALVFRSGRPRAFTDREQRLALGVGDYVLGAVERIRLREETEAARQRAEAFAAQAQQLAVLEERNRLARELHDSVSQALYGIALGARTSRAYVETEPERAVAPLDYVLTLSEAGLAEMRALIFELRPETLEKEGLIEALSKQVTMLQARHNLEVRTAFCPEPEIPIGQKEAVYWIAREALHNIVKHANASAIDLCLHCEAAAFTLTIRDDGVGFDRDGDFSGHLGLRSMSERAANIGGTLDIDSDPEQGTRIQFTLPLE